MHASLSFGKCIFSRCSARTYFVSLLLLYSGGILAASGKIPLVVVDQSRSAEIIKQVPLTGTVTSPRQSKLSSQVSGQVKSIKVDIGDQVKKGDVLILLDKQIEELALQAARAETQRKREELANAQRRYDSAKRLRKQNNISADEIDQREAEVKIAQAALQRQEAEEKRQATFISQHTIKAPFDGVISEKLTELGQWVDPGTTILTLVANDSLMIDFQVPQEFFPRIDASSRLTLTLPSMKNQHIESTVDIIVPVSDAATRTFLIRTRARQLASSLTPGMSANGLLSLSTGSQGVVVSRDALLRYPDGRVTVWIIKQDNEVAKVAERPVKVGHGFNDQVTILEGLEAGEIVVVQGNESLKQDQVVRIHTPR